MFPVLRVLRLLLFDFPLFLFYFFSPPLTRSLPSDVPSVASVAPSVPSLGPTQLPSLPPLTLPTTELSHNTALLYENGEPRYTHIPTHPHTMKDKPHSDYKKKKKSIFIF